MHWPVPQAYTTADLDQGYNVVIWTTWEVCGLREIGVREAKARLSELLRAVNRGEEWVLTQRGRKVAKLVPLGPSDRSVLEGVRWLELRGDLEPERQARSREIPEPIVLSDNPSQTWLQEERDRGR